MSINIQKGKLRSAQKVVIYAPEGLGKTTLASKFPCAVFIDTEGSTKKYNVARFYPGVVTSWVRIKEAINYTLKNPHEVGTLVLDTADWAEALAIKEVCDKHCVAGIEDIGYGKGYTYLAETFKDMLQDLELCVQAGVHVVITAHARLRKIEQPDEMGAYDHWEMKLSKQCAPLLKEWADMVLFGNYKTYVVEDTKTKSKKAQGGKRVMYTSHHPCWDAKNRDGLPSELPFEYDSIKHIIEGEAPEKAVKTPEKAVKTLEKAKKEPKPFTQDETEARKKNIEALEINADLKALMLEHNITAWDIQGAVACLKNAPYTSDVPITEYPEEFQQSLIKSFKGLAKKVKAIREAEEIPFK